jgi:hypothetical protein
MQLACFVRTIFVCASGAFLTGCVSDRSIEKSGMYQDCVAVPRGLVLDKYSSLPECWVFNAHRPKLTRSVFGSGRGVDGGSSGSRHSINRSVSDDSATSNNNANASSAGNANAASAGNTNTSSAGNANAASAGNTNTSSAGNASAASAGNTNASSAGNASAASAGGSESVSAGRASASTSAGAAVGGSQ